MYPNFNAVRKTENNTYNNLLFSYAHDVLCSRECGNHGGSHFGTSYHKV